MKTNSKNITGSRNDVGLSVFCDFDGTITQLDVTDEILTQLAHPSWREVEQEWICGSIGSRECLERQIALVDTSEQELDALLDTIPVDPGFPAFYQFTRQHRIPFYVVSDGFDHVIRRVLKRSGVGGPLRNGKHLFSSALHIDGRRLVALFPGDQCAHGCATCKPKVIERLAPEQTVVFIGDGLSDRFAVEVADVVFAKSHLLNYCRERNIACRPFETFADIAAAMEELLPSFAPPLRKPRAQGQKSKSQKSKVEGRKIPALTFNF